jgi:hypothetical protein
LISPVFGFLRSERFNIGRSWPPIVFDDIEAAFAHAIRVAKSWEGLSGGPGIRIKGVEGYALDDFADLCRWLIGQLLSIVEIVVIAPRRHRGRTLQRLRRVIARFARGRALGRIATNLGL